MEVLRGRRLDQRVADMVSAVVNRVAAGALAEAVQPRGEGLLQIRCRCSDERSSMQFVIVVRGDPGAPSGSVSSKCAARHFRETAGGQGQYFSLSLAAPISDNRGVGRRLSSFRGCLRRLAKG